MYKTSVHIRLLTATRASGRDPCTPRLGRGKLTYAQGLHAKYGKMSTLKKIYSKYKITKHVESLPKMDKSITFH